MKWLPYIAVLFALCIAGCLSKSVDKKISDSEKSKLINQTPQAENRKKHRTQSAGSTNKHDVQKKHEEVMHYWLLVTGDVSDRFFERSFNDDKMFSIGGAEIGGMLTLYVNESPVDLFSFGGMCIRITDGVQSGKNRITIQGKLKEPVYVKVFTTRSPILSLSPPPIIEEVLVKKKLPLPDVRINLDFEAGITFSDPRDELPQEGTRRSLLEAELRSLIRLYVNRLENHDGHGVYEIGKWPTGDQAVPWPSYMKDDQNRRLKGRPKLIELLSNPNLKILTSADDVKLIWGKKTVISYAGVGTFNDIPKPYLFRLTIDDLEVNFTPIRWVRISGKWINW